MTKNEAIEFEQQLKQFMTQEAMNMELSVDRVTGMIDQYVEIYPDKFVSMGMFDLDEKSKSIRSGNIRFNLKGLWTAAANFAISAVIPATGWGYFVMVLNGLLFVSGVADSIIKEISENEAYVVSFLHSHDMYAHGLPEGDFENAFKIWYREKTDEEMSSQRIKKALDSLYDLEAVEIIDGEIRLKEKVWRNRL